VVFGNRTCDAVEFDVEGNVYTLIETGRGKFLAVSTDGLKTFSAIQVPEGSVRIEPWRVNVVRHQSPPILLGDRAGFFLVPITFENGKNLSLGRRILLAGPEAQPEAQITTMAGAGAPLLTVGGKTFFAYTSRISASGLTGSPHYIVECDRETGKVGAPLLLGSTGHQIDGHNLPVIDIDSKGFIHVIAGAHWHAFKHFVSRQPLSVAGGFREVARLGTASANQWSRNGLTYPGLVIDANDQLHLLARGRSQILAARDRASEYVQRNSSEYLNYGLVYFRGSPDGKWEGRRDVVIPAWRLYGNWYHKLVPDRNGGLHATYYYDAQKLWQSPAALKTYQHRWPEEKVPNGAAADEVMKAHDPVILSSYDGGASWSPTTTTDFLKAIR
jgi:hypothetical protein